MKVQCMLLFTLGAQAAYQETQGNQEYEGESIGYQEEPAYTPVAQSYQAKAAYQPKLCDGQCHHNKPCWDAGKGQCVATVCKGQNHQAAGSYEYGTAQTYSAAQTYSGDQGAEYSESQRKLQDQDGQGYSADAQDYEAEGDTYAPETYAATYAYGGTHYKCGNCVCPDATERCTDGCAAPSSTGRTMWWVGVIIFIFGVCGLLRKGLLYQGTFKAVYKIQPFLAATICLVAATEYVILAGGQGMYAYCPEDRPVNWARYVSWLICSTLLMLMLSIMGGLEIWRRWILILADIAMIIAGFWGSFPADNSGSSGGKWIFLLVAVVALVVVYIMLTKATSWNGGVVGGQVWARDPAYRSAVQITMFLFSLYGLVWTLSVAADLLCADTEIVLYGLLDLAIKPGLGYYLAFQADRLYGAVPTGGGAPMVPTQSSFL